MVFTPPPRIVCFVCAAEVPADYPLYVEPQHGHLASPHFPFLVAHSPPLGCLPVESTSGEAKSCRPCYTTLMKQWEEYDRTRIPVSKRIYWIKRADGLPFLNPEQQQQAAHQVQVKIHKNLLSAAGSSSTPAVGVTGGVMVAPLPPVVTSHDSLSSTQPDSRTKTTSSAPQAHVLLNFGRDIRRPPSQTVAASSATGEETAPSSGVGGDNDSALDLSSGSRERETMKSRSSVASHVSVVSHHSYQSEGAGSSTDILDLTLPDKNAAFEVCYVCGDEFKKGLLSFTFAKQINKEPFYPSLICHARPPRSRPMDSSGRVQTCDECHNHLLQQWFQFESEDMPHSDRKYTLRKRQVPALDNATFVCYLCALDYHSSSLKLLYARPNSEQEPYYPFIEQQKPPPGASPISPQGMVQVCNLCYKSTKEKHHGFLKADQPPPKKRLKRYEPADNSHHPHDEDDKAQMPADVTCILCRRKFSVGSFKFLHTQGPPVGGLPYFPFLVDLARPDECLESEDDKLGRVRACQACTTSLMNQWTAFQREGTSIVDRQYTYPSLVTGPRSVSSVRAQSPASQKSGTLTPGRSSLTAHPVSGEISSQQQLTQSSSALANPTTSPRTRSNTLESRPRSVSNPQSPNPPPPIPSPATTVTSSNPRATPTIPPATNAPVCHSPSYSATSATSTPATESIAVTTTSGVTVTTNNSNVPKTATTSSFYCFLCGLHSELSFSRMLYSTAQGKKAPYFPFMKKHVPKNKAETLREDGTALVCTFCYHSVMVQWSKFNDSKSFVEPNQRKYNIHDYNCYVCGITTYRKRIRALRVLVSERNYTHLQYLFLRVLISCHIINFILLLSKH